MLPVQHMQHQEQVHAPCLQNLLTKSASELISSGFEGRLVKDSCTSVMPKVFQVMIMRKCKLPVTAAHLACQGRRRRYALPVTLSNLISYALCRQITLVSVDITKRCVSVTCSKTGHLRAAGIAILFKCLFMLCIAIYKPGITAHDMHQACQIVPSGRQCDG